MPPQSAKTWKTSSPSATSNNLRPVRSRKDRPCDYCRRLKHTCRILVRGQACTNCARTKRTCTFEDPPRKRHAKPHIQLAEQQSDITENQYQHDSSSSTALMPNDDRSNHDPFIPAFSQTAFEQQTSNAIYGDQVALQSSQQPLHSSLAAIFEVEENSSDDNSYYTSLDLENDGSEEHHYLGPGALMHLTLNVDQDDSTWSQFLNPQNTTTPSGTETSDLNKLSYRQIADSKKPVFFLREPSRVYGLSNASYEAEKAWKTACEVLSYSQAGQGEHISHQLIHIFLESTLSALPLINKVRLQASMYQWHGAHPFPHALLVGILAHSAVSVPGLRTIWKDLWAIVLNLLDNEYRQPRLQTLQLAIMDIWGRPNQKPGGNHTAICRAIGAAQVLGLHKDSSQWRLPRWERSTRKRIWWLIYVADKWNSLTYGRPSNVPTETTVSLPSSLDNDDGGQSSTCQNPIISFILMCRLTIILNTLLPILSDTSGESDKFSTHRQAIMKAAMELEELERLHPVEGDAGSPGMVRLASLSLDEVLAGLVFSMPFNSHPRAGPVARHIIAVIAKLVLFLESLDEEDCKGFWTPWSSSQLTHAMSLALRLFVRLSSSESDPPQSQPQPQFPSSSNIFNLIDWCLTVLTNTEAIWEVASDALGKIRILMASMPDLEGLSELRMKIGLGRYSLPSQDDTMWSDWLSLLGMEWLNNDGLNTTLAA
ncbi:hypothetical protein I203_107879 [Kwoniella mangroviensis CBS 8507]|uniref:hypothetical protein n=1 Tax=Kwoniella mangroviensis CBS 8507 TaxID=1296122 RepID=UPI00080CD70F|nr:uncharacterized protein I203_08186 [Kwoniella mangroviensis CBS 8507]OCF62774.1 hypothetical protein I203_08186 [Kwoniella mangroviensis CBS 8507]